MPTRMSPGRMPSWAAGLSGRTLFDAHAAAIARAAALERACAAPRVSFSPSTSHDARVIASQRRCEPRACSVRFGKGELHGEWSDRRGALRRPPASPAARSRSARSRSSGRARGRRADADDLVAGCRCRACRPGCRDSTFVTRAAGRRGCRSACVTRPCHLLRSRCDVEQLRGNGRAHCRSEWRSRCPGRRPARPR